MTTTSSLGAVAEGRRLTYLSLGAGVQSSTLALMAAHGEIGPMPDGAVFADTQSEPDGVYEWLDWLEKKLPFPVIRVTRGNLADDACRVRTSKAGNHYTKHAVPAFMRDTDGRIGLAMRQCTSDHKISIIYREYRRRHKKQPIEQWIGISRDEAIRMKPSRIPYVTNRWPLIEMGMTRADCLTWMKEKNFPTPPRSACVFCPFHDDREWSLLKDTDPDGFARAVAFEKNFQAAAKQVETWRGVPFLHRSCKPIEEVDFRPEANRLGQLNFSFGNECEGMCGV
jgi:hypothetical protein